MATFELGFLSYEAGGILAEIYMPGRTENLAWLWLLRTGLGPPWIRLTWLDRITSLGICMILWWYQASSCGLASMSCILDILNMIILINIMFFIIILESHCCVYLCTRNMKRHKETTYLFASDKTLSWNRGEKQTFIVDDFHLSESGKRYFFLYWEVSISMNYKRMRSCANKLAQERELGSDITEGVGEIWECCQEINHLQSIRDIANVAILQRSTHLNQAAWCLSDWCVSVR